MKYLLYTDPHWCAYSSIIRSRGKKFTTRLENLIDSLNWVEDLALKNLCSATICLGDFFDKTELNAEELTALNEVKWNDWPHYFIVGNHESNLSSLMFSSTNALTKKDNFHIVDKPLQIFLPSDGGNLVLLPYILEEDRKPFKDYMPKNGRTIVLSHNDIKGIQYGGFLSKIGFNLKDIEDNCALFINGHLHNGTYLNDKKTILNLGNLTGLNFGEDSFKYEHRVAILDTDTLKLQFFVNPFAFNFFKLEINSLEDITKYAAYFSSKSDKGIADITSNNPIITARCRECMIEKTKAFLDDIPDLVESKILIATEESSSIDEKDISQSELTKDDHLNQFSKFVLDKLGKSDIIEEELSFICKESE